MVPAPVLGASTSTRTPARFESGEYGTQTKDGTIYLLRVSGDAVEFAFDAGDSWGLGAGTIAPSAKVVILGSPLSPEPVGAAVVDGRGRVHVVRSGQDIVLERGALCARTRSQGYAVPRGSVPCRWEDAVAFCALACCSMLRNEGGQCTIPVDLRKCERDLAAAEARQLQEWRLRQGPVDGGQPRLDSRTGSTGR